MLVALWIINALLALIFVAAGGFKLLKPRDSLAESGMAWAKDFSAGTVKLIGLSEVLGAAGLILPLLTDIATILTPLASVGLLVVMVGAVVVHVRRKEPAGIQYVLTGLTAASAVIGFIHVLG